MKSDISKRILKLVENENISVRALEKKIGASNGVISRCVSKNSDISSIWVSKIVEMFPSYSAEWLLTGKGSMLKSKKEKLETGKSSERPVSTEPIYLIESVKELAIENHELKKEIEELKREKKAKAPPDYNIAAEPVVKPTHKK